MLQTKEMYEQTNLFIFFIPASSRNDKTFQKFIIHKYFCSNLSSDVLIFTHIQLYQVCRIVILKVYESNNMLLKIISGQCRLLTELQTREDN